MSKCKNSEEASVLFWNWLLAHTKLTPKNAALHNIYQQDSTAVFYDLNGDGKREILGTHYATATAGMGDCLLYILEYDETKKLKYKKISENLYFDVTLPVEILEDKNAGFSKIKVFSNKDTEYKIFSFDRKKDMYLYKK